ncbi:MAG: phage portal protein, partial [Solirubrobacterales bacterium]
MTEILLPGILGDKPQQRMRTAWQMGVKVKWVRAAERVISGKFANVEWHLEDPASETIDEKYPDTYAREAHMLLSRPQSQLEIGQRLTRFTMWQLTSRHMGLCGPAFWYFDQPNAYGIPLNILYLRPDRVEAGADKKGNLEQWIIDRQPGQPGVQASLEQMLQFNLEPPDDGYFGVGLIETALQTGQMSQAFDKHVTDVLATGGRLAGVLSPKIGAFDTDQYEQAVRDWRSISEQPNAARRLQVVKAPVDFIRTAATERELDLVKLMTLSRDDLLNLWGVPLSQLGGYSPTGLNSGDVRKYDEAALWQNAVDPRLKPFAEVVQTGLLDRYKPLLGWSPKLVLDVPKFDDDSPRYAMAAQSLGLPLRGVERRQQVGLDPLGPDVIGPSGLPVDEEIYILNTMVQMNQSGQPPVPEPAELPGYVPDITDTDEFGAPAAARAYRNRPPARPGPAAGPQALPSRTAPASTPPPLPGRAGKASLDQETLRTAVHGLLDQQYPGKLTDWVDEATWTYVPEMPIKSIVAPARSGKKRVDESKITAVSAMVKTGAPTRAIVVAQSDQLPKGEVALADGWHHFQGYLDAGAKTVPVYMASDCDAPVDKMQSPKYDEGTKASIGDGLRSLRERLTSEVTPNIAASVRRVLEQQQRSVVSRVRTLPAYRLRDPAHLWPAPLRAEWDQMLGNALRPHLTTMAEQVHGHITSSVHKAGPVSVMVNPHAPAPVSAVTHVLTRGAARVGAINERTRVALQKIIVDGVDEGLP